MQTIQTDRLLLFVVKYFKTKFEAVRQKLFELSCDNESIYWWTDNVIIIGFPEFSCGAIIINETFVKYILKFESISSMVDNISISP